MVFLPLLERRDAGGTPALRWLLRRGGGLVLRLRFEVAGVVAFVQLLRGVAGGAVYHAPALDGGACVDLVGPAIDVFVLVHAEEFGGAVLPELHQPPTPRETRHIG